jgi:hypothetical protein
MAKRSRKNRQALPLPPPGTIEPYRDPPVEQVFAAGLHGLALVKAQRERIAAAAELVRRMARDGRSLQEVVPDRWDGVFPQEPDDPETVHRFYVACRELARAAEAARAIIPPSAAKGRAPDEVDGAPSLARLPGTLAVALARAGRHVTGVPLGRLARSVGISPPSGKIKDPEANPRERERSAWQKLARSAAQRSHIVSGRNRRKK